MQKLLITIFTILFFPLGVSADVRDSIVKIYAVHNSPDYFNPWSMLGPRSTTGSGCVIEGNRILTNAHVVSDQTFIQIRRNGSSKRFRALVQSVNHEADLAILEVDNEKFFEGVKPLPFGKLPESQDEVLVYGFPLGGDTLSTTKGVVSRLEHHNYTHSSTYLLAAQIDAAINAGNSGGPVIVDGRIVGVVMQAVSAKSAENVGYMVPVSIVKHYLRDIEDGVLNGVPALGISFQTLENPDLRQRYKVSENQTGLLVNKVFVNSPLGNRIRTGDILLSIDGNPIADDGTVVFRGRERTSFLHFLQLHQLEQELELEVLREGNKISVDVPLTLSNSARYLVPHERYERLPTYYIYGGLVFTPLTKNLMKRWGPNWFKDAPKHLVSKLTQNYPEKQGEEVVILLKILASDLTEGYHQYAFWIVKTVDGTEVLNMRNLVELLESSDTEHVTIVNSEGYQLILNREKVKKAQDEILRIYQIPESRSADMS